MSNDFKDPITFIITWAKCGSWLPGDSRGWMEFKKGEQQPQPVLDAWCKGRSKSKQCCLMFSNGTPWRILSARIQSAHLENRGWGNAGSAQSNHVYVVVTVVPKIGNQNFHVVDGVNRVRDQFKANATRVLRKGENPNQNETF